MFFKWRGPRGVLIIPQVRECFVMAERGNQRGGMTVGKRESERERGLQQLLSVRVKNAHLQCTKFSHSIHQHTPISLL